LIEYEKIASWDSLHEVASDDGQDEWQWQHALKKNQAIILCMADWYIIAIRQCRKADWYMNNVNV
jgi:hypothetical protein